MVKYPGDWEVKTIGELFNVFAGGDTKKEYFSRIKTSEHRYEVFSNGVENRGLYSYTSKALYPANSLTVSARGTIGRAFYRDKEFDAIIRLLVLIPKSNNVIPKFYEYYINSRIVFENESTGVAQLTAPKIREKNIPLPTLEEQTAIADTLAAFDTHISNLTELIAKKKAIREGALDELMTGRTRLKGFCGEWRDAKIGDILKILHGKDKRNVESPAGHYPILGTGGIIGKAIKPLCDWECVLIGRKGTIDRPYYMDKPFWSIDTLYYSKPEENQCVKYQYYLFCSINWYDYMESSGRPSLTRKAIENIKIKLPPLDEQTAIADTLTALDKEISSLEAERAKISNIRDGAMNDLLTGKVRLIHGNRKTAPEPRNSLASR
ncbi:MAG: restriction endonuclease subunit S [Synergistaceae bacterium]|nr:restriction endonuclease subunit S [Synergistaceae bacterium]